MEDAKSHKLTEQPDLVVGPAAVYELLTELALKWVLAEADKTATIASLSCSAGKETEEAEEQKRWVSSAACLSLTSFCVIVTISHYHDAHEASAQIPMSCHFCIASLHFSHSHSRFPSNSRILRNFRLAFPE